MAKANNTTPAPVYQIEPGQIYGKLTVVRRCPTMPHRKWECVCACGTVCSIEQSQIAGGRRKSCSHSCAVTKHGHATDARGQSPEYRAWHNMMLRCTNPATKNYNIYGGRGITVCERWKNFANFIEDVGPKPGPGYSLDRIDNDGNYEPGNVKWSTKIEQDNNRRTCHYVTIDGTTLSLSQWARKIGIKPSAIYQLVRGGDIESKVRQRLPSD